MLTLGSLYVLELDLLGTIDVVGIGEQADGHARTRHIGEPTRQLAISSAHQISSTSSLDSARETLVTLGVVVLETDLEFDGLDEVALLFGGTSQDFLDGTPHA